MCLLDILYALAGAGAAVAFLHGRIWRFIGENPSDDEGALRLSGAADERTHRL